MDTLAYIVMVVEPVRCGRIAVSRALTFLVSALV